MSLKKIYSNLPNSVKKKIDKLSFNFSHNVEEDFIFNSDVGKNYNLSTNDKKKIVQLLKYSISNIASATDINIHFLLDKLKILSQDFLSIGITESLLCLTNANLFKDFSFLICSNETKFFNLL